jgi:hypothetical protein
MKSKILSLLLLPILVTAADQADRNTAATQVRINGETLSAPELADIQARVGSQFAPGSYWYDARCGAFGTEGGPALGFTVAGLPVKGKLKTDASGGGTGVFINGRELHPLDVLALQSCSPVYPGRYWVDASGNGGMEGGPMQFNLESLCNAAKKAYVGQEDGVVYSKYGNTIVGDGISGFNDHNGGGFTSGN